MSQHDDKVRIGKQRLEEAGADQVGRRLLHQVGLVEIPVPAPAPEEPLRVLLADQRRAFRQVRAGIEAEAPRSSVGLCGGVNVLQMLTLILGSPGMFEAADSRMLLERLEEERSTASMESADEDESMVLKVVHSRSSYHGLVPSRVGRERLRGGQGLVTQLRQQVAGNRFEIPDVLSGGLRPPVPQALRHRKAKAVLAVRVAERPGDRLGALRIAEHGRMEIQREVIAKRSQRLLWLFHQLLVSDLT